MTATHPFVTRPNRTLLGLAVPVMASLVVEPLAGVVDTAFVERLGAEQAAALGAATAILSSILWIFNFLGIGTQTEVAHATGRGATRDARAVTSLALAISAIAGIGIAAAMWPLLGSMAAWMSEEPESVSSRS